MITSLIHFAAILPVYTYSDRSLLMTHALTSTQRLYEETIHSAMIDGALGLSTSDTRRSFVKIIKPILDILGVAHDRSFWLAMDIVDMIKKTSSEVEASRAISALITKAKGQTVTSLGNRDKYFAEVVQEHILPGTLLDYGCGNGGIAWELLTLQKDDSNYDHNPLLYDIRDDRDGFPAHMMFTSTKEGLTAHVEKYGPFDNALMLMVAHHCEDPKDELAFLGTLTKRVILIESIVSEWNSYPEQALIDWFYNRCLHPGEAIPVPGNFKPWADWLSITAKLGWVAGHHQDLGIDIPICPEHHYLIVFTTPLGRA